MHPRPSAPPPLSACVAVIHVLLAPQTGVGLALTHHLLPQASLPPPGHLPGGGADTPGAPALPWACLPPVQLAALPDCAPPPPGHSLPSRDLPASLVRGVGTLASSRLSRAGRAGAPSLVRRSPGLTGRGPSAPVLVSVKPWRRGASSQKKKAGPRCVGTGLRTAEPLVPSSLKRIYTALPRSRSFSVNAYAPHRDSRQTLLSTPFAEETGPGHRA